MSKRLLMAAAAAALLAATVNRSTLSAQTDNAKLATVLADLSRSAASGVRSESVDALPVSVQDALRAGSLRINASNEAQVYVLLNDVSDESLGALTTAGVTIELRDLASYRVQARVD